MESRPGEGRITFARMGVACSFAQIQSMARSGNSSSLGVLGRAGCVGVADRQSAVKQSTKRATVRRTRGGPKLYVNYEENTPVPYIRVIQ